MLILVMVGKQFDQASMGSPLGPVLANIFMAELEIAKISSCGNYFKNWKWFVGYVFATVLPDKIGYRVDQPNTFDKSIQVTYDMEEDNKLSFLNTTIYWKPTTRCLYWLALTFDIAMAENDS